MAAPDPAPQLSKDSSCTGGGVHTRPDTWQHPIPRRSCPKILLAPEGASTHGSTRSRAAAVQRFFLHRRGLHTWSPSPHMVSIFSQRWSGVSPSFVAVAAESRLAPRRDAWPWSRNRGSHGVIPPLACGSAKGAVEAPSRHDPQTRRPEGTSLGSVPRPRTGGTRR